MARHRRSWRDVGCAGMAGGDGIALVLISHEGVDRHEVETVLRRRWPEVVVKEPEQEEPTVAMSPSDAADLGRCRRGVEPLRIVVMPSTTATNRLIDHRIDARGRPDRCGRCRTA
jgi:hypothetical protein